MVRKLKLVRASKKDYPLIFIKIFFVSLVDVVLACIIAAVFTVYWYTVKEYLGFKKLLKVQKSLHCVTIHNDYDV